METNVHANENGNPEWCMSLWPHGHETNKIKTLRDYDPEIMTAIMTSPAWTKAAIIREPMERVLSTVLDKAVKTNMSTNAVGSSLMKI
jgi:hypothetical protein